MFHQDGQYSLLKLSIGKELFHYHSTAIGLELGVETGNTMRLDISKTLLNQLGGLPFQSQMKPTSDLLGIIRAPIYSTRLNVLLKTGVAFRTWQFERCSADDRSQVDPEFQFGFAWQVNNSVYLQLSGRTIIGQKVRYSINPLEEQLIITGMPSQYGVLIGTTFFFE